MSRSGNTHWCYQCNSMVNVSARDTSCSRCGGGFVQELEEVNSRGILDLLGVDYDDQSSVRLMETLSAFLSSRSGRSREIDTRGRFPDQGRPVGFGSSPVVVFRGQIPAEMVNNGGMQVIFNGGSGIGLRRLPANFSDYFMGQDLEELIEQLTMSDRRGPPPAPHSAIEAMPTIKISQRHLRLTPTVQFAKRSLRLVQKLGKCLASTSTTVNASCLGWSNTILALSVVTNCRHRLSAVQLAAAVTGTRLLAMETHGMAI